MYIWNIHLHRDNSFFHGLKINATMSFDTSWMRHTCFDWFLLEFLFVMNIPSLTLSHWKEKKRKHRNRKILGDHSDRQWLSVLCVITACPPAHQPFSPPHHVWIWTNGWNKTPPPPPLPPPPPPLRQPTQMRHGVTGSTLTELLGQTESCSLWFSRSFPRRQ